MSQLCAQQPVQSELVQRCQQLQSRLSTLKIENEEVGNRQEPLVAFAALVSFQKEHCAPGIPVVMTRLVTCRRRAAEDITMLVHNPDLALQ